MKLCALLVFATIAAPAFSQQIPVSVITAGVNAQLPALLATYKDLHRHPELSHHEANTAAFFAAQLRKAGYQVTEHIGKYPDGTPAYGVVAVLQNGAGPQVWLRNELDALPVEEKTALPYASHDHAVDTTGKSVFVMHACGHDIHITAMLGAAEMLAQLKSKWHGTLVVIGQPSEETLDGARAMLADNLYTRFGRPDFVLAQHDQPNLVAGQVGITSGPAYAGADSVNVTILGVGGHGAMPQATKDPIVMAAEFILEVQTLVSRQTNPLEPAVVTIGSIKGGTQRNIIPDKVEMQLTVRFFNDQVGKNIVEGISRIAQGIAVSNGLDAAHAPVVDVPESVPVTYNDPALAARIESALQAALGPKNVEKQQPIMPSEDFGLFGLPGHQIPTFMLALGAVDAGKIAESRRTGVPLPGLHSPLFAPLPEPTLRTGVIAMTTAALELLGK